MSNAALFVNYTDDKFGKNVIKIIVARFQIDAISSQ